MNSPRLNVSESPQTIQRRRSSRLSEFDEFSSKIPIDLIAEIFSTLPLKSIATCRCVSKRWASLLRCSAFTELFLTKSLTRPQLLFVHRTHGKNEAIFFSSPQPQNPHLDSNPTAIVEHRVRFPLGTFLDISSPVNGYVCTRTDQGKPRDHVLVCNPSTGQSYTLPKIKKRERTFMRSYLGYDPIEKQHKVLAVTTLDNSVVDHQVLTMRGIGNMTWRLIECDIPHFIPGESICINGVLYYTAWDSYHRGMVVCFDVRSEKYSFIRYGMHYATLVDYNGKLALVKQEPYVVTEWSTSFEMWVLENLEKHEWSKRIFNIPSMLKDAASRQSLRFVGVTDTNELVLAPYYPSDPFPVYYCNFDKETVTRVKIQGMAVEKDSRVVTFLNHVEDVKLMELV